MKSDQFCTTHWSVVLAAAEQGSPRSQAALETLCATYWYPLYAFIRRQGRGHHEAQDLVQEFFLLLLDKQVLGGLKQDRGKFRSFLLTALKCFLANEWHRQHAVKRGGGKVLFSIDDTAETRYEGELIEVITPENLYERQWAWTVLDQVLARLEDEYVKAGKAKLFLKLQGYLPGLESRESYDQIATALQMNQPALRVAVHRLRSRFGELLRAEVAATVSCPEEINPELQHLISMIGQG